MMDILYKIAGQSRIDGCLDERHKYDESRRRTNANGEYNEPREDFKVGCTSLGFGIPALN